MSNDPFFAPLSGVTGVGPAKADPSADFVSVTPVPPDAPTPPRRHPRAEFGVPSRMEAYYGPDRALLGFQCRFDRADGSKAFQPLTLFRETATGALKWKWKGWPDPRPLYGLDRLAARPEAPVLLCEGEKAADAAGELAPDFVAITSPNGSKSANKADWSPLKGRRVVIWRDADPAGLEYAEAAAALILAADAGSVSLLDPPGDAPQGWDAADALADGWPTVRVLRLVASARPVGRPAVRPAPTGRPAPTPAAVEASPAEDGGKRGPGRPPWHDTLLGLTKEYVLWHTPKKHTYASIPRPGGHRENWRLNGEAFARDLSLKAFEETGRVPSKAAIEETVRILEAKAIAYGPCRKEWLRVGERDGKLYLDLGCPQWRAIEISANGPEILEGHDLPFVRPEGMQALPDPVFGEENAINDLRTFVNADSDEDFHLIVAWVLGSMRAAEEYPLLILNGEQGTGKSTLSRLLRSIVDPHAIDMLSAPKEDRDLFVLAQHAHLVALDNLSKVENWMSDSLCILATGGAMASRSMYTNDGLSILEAKRPVILNGIPTLADRPDLAQRSITVRLKPVPAEERRTSADIKREWEAAAPRILGTFLEALARGLRDVDGVTLDRLPRMAGFARFMVAAAPGLGLDGRALFDAYLANQSELASSAFENDPVATAIVALMQRTHSGEWQGTPTDLLQVLSDPEVTPERITNSFAWPRKAQTLGNAVERIAPALRDRGIDVRKRHSGKTFYEIRARS